MYGNHPPPPGCLDQSPTARDWAVPESIDFDGFQNAIGNNVFHDIYWAARSAGAVLKCIDPDGLENV